MTGSAPEVVVRGIAAGGDGVATLPDGRTVFVPRAAPGDRLQLRGVRLHARFARAEVGELVEAGPDRVDPPCPHYIRDRCGGCQVMHLSAPAQRAAKARSAGDALRRLAKLDIDDPDIAPAPSQFSYRSKVTLAVRGDRLGYRRIHDPDSVFDVRTCLVAEPGVQRLIDALRGARRHLPRHATRVVLRRDRNDGLHVVVRTDPGPAWTDGGAMHHALVQRGVPATVWWHPEGGAPRAVAGSINPWPVTVFEQVHPAMGQLVRQAALDALGEVRGQHVWDLYSGFGETTVALVERGATVESIERDARAVAQAERIGPAGPVRHAGTAEELAARLRAPAAIVTNPPRTGMDAEVSRVIAASGASRIVYISCDPATLSRDIARLANEYEVRLVKGFDQFPQTAHLECVALLERR